MKVFKLLRIDLCTINPGRAGRSVSEQDVTFRPLLKPIRLQGLENPASSVNSVEEKKEKKNSVYPQSLHKLHKILQPLLISLLLTIRVRRKHFIALFMNVINLLLPVLLTNLAFLVSEERTRIEGSTGPMFKVFFPILTSSQSFCFWSKMPFTYVQK